MVIGNGTVAKVFSDYQENDEFLIFASGVSNSNEKSEANFEREKRLLEHAIAENSTKHLVYFSSCSVYDGSLRSSLYVLHKLRMEELIQATATKWTIFRVSNIVGGGKNPHTLTNYLHHTIVNGLSFELWTKATRNLIDIDHVSSIIKYHITHEPCNKIVNVANEQNYTLNQIVYEFERILNKEANYTEIAQGSGFTIDVSDILHFLPLLHIEFDNTYLTNLLTKHYVKEQ